MSRRPEEQPAVEAFARFLTASTGRVWTPSADEIPNPSNGKSYDCEFRSDGVRPIAADIFRLYPLGSDQRGQGTRQKIIDKLTTALRAEGVGGLHFETPIPQKEHVDPRWFKETARQFRDALAQTPLALEFEANGVRATRAGGLDDPITFGHFWFSFHQPIEAAGYPLIEILRSKNDQLAVEGHDRYLIGLGRGIPSSLEDVTASLAFIDLQICPNIDRVYFETSGDGFCLVYDRLAREAMDAGRLPMESEQRRLVVQWIEVRMGAHWPSGLDLALLISWDQNSSDWLSPGGRTLLELEAHLLLQQCGWNTPREFWELHRGELPLIGDGRRRIQPILAV